MGLVNVQGIREVSAEVRATAATASGWRDTVAEAAGIQWTSPAAERYRQQLVRFGMDLDARIDALTTAAAAVDAYADEVDRTLAVIRQVREACMNTFQRAHHLADEAGRQLMQFGEQALHLGWQEVLLSSRRTLSHLPPTLPDEHDLQWLALGRTLGVHS